MLVPHLPGKNNCLANTRIHLKDEIHVDHHNCILRIGMLRMVHDWVGHLWLNGNYLLSGKQAVALGGETLFKMCMRILSQQPWLGNDAVLSVMLGAYSIVAAEG
jgi:hypothetical protein